MVRNTAWTAIGTILCPVSRFSMISPEKCPKSTIVSVALLNPWQPARKMRRRTTGVIQAPGEVAERLTKSSGMILDARSAPGGRGAGMHRVNPTLLAKLSGRRYGHRRFQTLWRGGRAVECTGLENQQGLVALRGFESHPLRHLE